jgi:Ca2+/Na+ antiporter
VLFEHHVKRYAGKILEGALSKVGECLLLLIVAASIFLIHWARSLSLAYRAILIVLLALCFLGFLCLLISYRRRVKKKLEMEQQAAAAAEARKRTSDAFTAEDIKGMRPSPDFKDPNYPIDYEHFYLRPEDF